MPKRRRQAIAPAAACDACVTWIICSLLLPCIVMGTAYAGFDEGRDALEKGDYATALIELQPLADQGHPAAQVLLGEMYLTGRGTSPDERQAREWFRKAAAQGEAIAQDNLGVMYQGGRGGLAQDDRQAAQWFRKAAEQGYAPAEHDLGNMYLNGSGVPQDDGQAVAWYRKAAEQGYPPAQHNLGFSYFNGRGVPQDDRQAVEWYRRAAAQGFAASQNNLGVMYQSGRGGLQQDDQQAVEWYRSAAEQGIADAQVNLGNLYLNGRGVPRDAVLAYMLFSLAAASGDKVAADDRVSVVQGLSLKQIEKANELAKMWTPGTPLPRHGDVSSK